MQILEGCCDGRPMAAISEYRKGSFGLQQVEAGIWRLLDYGCGKKVGGTRKAGGDTVAPQTPVIGLRSPTFYFHHFPFFKY
jgi:hypothetical protein